MTLAFAILAVFNLVLVVVFSWPATDTGAPDVPGLDVVPIDAKSHRNAAYVAAAPLVWLIGAIHHLKDKVG